MDFIDRAAIAIAPAAPTPPAPDVEEDAALDGVQKRARRKRERRPPTYDSGVDASAGDAFHAFVSMLPTIPPSPPGPERVAFNVGDIYISRCGKAAMRVVRRHGGVLTVQQRPIRGDWGPPTPRPVGEQRDKGRNTITEQLAATGAAAAFSADSIY